LSLLFHSAFCLCFFLFPDPAFSPIYTLSLHDALPICLFSTLSICSRRVVICGIRFCCFLVWSVCCMARFFLRILEQKDSRTFQRSEEHTSELQSRFDLVCRLLLEKQKTAVKNY